MARVFVNYTAEQLLSLSVIMAVILSREYDTQDQVILSQLLNSVSTNLSLIIDQKNYLQEFYEGDSNDTANDEVDDVHPSNTSNTTKEQ